MSETSDNEVDKIAFAGERILYNEIPEDSVSKTLDDSKNIFSRRLKTQGDVKMLSSSHQGRIPPEATSQLEIELVPYQKLPAEILAKIFRYSLDGWPVMLPIMLFSRAMPWVLCWVCSRWRSIVLADQQVWANVLIWSSDDCSQVAVRELLSRSGSSGLKLSTSLETSIFNIVLKHCARVESLSLNDIRPSHRDSLAHIGSFTKLQSLKLCYHRSANIVITPETEISTYISLPTTVREFVISGPCVGSVPFHTLGFNLESPAWASLAYFNIFCPVSVKPLDMLVIFSQCKELLECEIYLETIPYQNIVYPKPITVPKLQSLAIFPEAPFALGRFLDSLILPSLIGLTIENTLESEWPHDEILRMIARSQHHLKSFEFHGNLVSSDNAISLIRAMPHLTMLHLEVDPPLSDEQFNTIIEECLLPCLEELYIHVDPSAEILNFLDLMRLRQPNRISRGTLFIDRYSLTDEERQMVKELERGLSARKMDFGVDFI